jgi:hypothetical protein
MPALKQKIPMDTHEFPEAQAPRLQLDPGAVRADFDRRPFGFAHNLHELPLFQPNALYALAEKYCDAPAHCYVSGGASSPGMKFYSGAAVAYKPHEALEQLESGNYRVLLKRLEQFDPRFRELLDTLFQQVMDAVGGIGNDRVVRMESAVFISSAATITPFHYDPEINFFSQIEGEKIYHVYAPAAVTEQELESFYARGEVDIAQVGLNNRERSYEHTFALAPGKGLHQPQNAPHWVETTASRSISYSFVYETVASRAKGRVRAFNHLMRSVGLQPAGPGRSAGVDAAKAAAMRAVLPIRRRVARAVRRGKPPA